jgi:predicted TIM-barrel fold metal-dependent hydrolase
MEEHNNLVLCLSASYGVHLGIEDLYRRFGAERLAFGSGYPATEGGASIAALTYSNLPQEAKEAIACHNLERILDRGR